MELAQQGDLSNQYIILENDIDLSGISFAHAVIPRFSGILDGNGHHIRNLTITGNGHTGLGLIGELELGGYIKDLGITDANVYGPGSETGILTGLNEGVISNCFSTGLIKGYYVGGLVGLNEGMIINSYSHARISGPVPRRSVPAGGLVGVQKGVGQIANCYSCGPVTPLANAGGLVGWIITPSCEVYNSFWDVERSGQTESAGGVGLTTAQLQQTETFARARWDLVGDADGLHDIWTVSDGEAHPVLNRFSGFLPAQLKGRGTAQDPFLISTPMDLASLRYMNIGAYACLAADLDLTGITWSMPVIPTFMGFFDGDSHVIRNLTINGIACLELGLFGRLETGGHIRDLGVVDAKVGGSKYDSGILVGENHGSISRCFTSGSVSGSWHVGGLAGSCSAGIVEDCHSQCTVKGVRAVGRLIGYLHSGTVANCYATGIVHSDSQTGGLVGQNEGGVIVNGP